MACTGIFLRNNRNHDFEFTNFSSVCKAFADVIASYPAGIVGQAMHFFVHLALQLSHFPTCWRVFVCYVNHSITRINPIPIVCILSWHNYFVLLRLLVVCFILIYCLFITRMWFLGRCSTAYPWRSHWGFCARIGLLRCFDYRLFCVIGSNYWLTYT